MAVPAIISNESTLNTWLDGLNNVISELTNTSAHLLVNAVSNPTPSVGNVALNGTATFWSVIVKNSVSGNTLFSTNTTGVLTNGTLTVVNTASFQNTITVAGAVTLNSTLTVDLTTTLAGATNVGSTLGVAQLATFSNSANVVGTLQVSNSTTTHAKVNSSACNIAVPTTVASNVVFSGTQVLVNGTLISNGTFTRKGPEVIEGVQLASALSGASDSVEPDLTINANTHWYQLDVIDATLNKSVSGILAANTTAYRIVEIYHAGNNSVRFLHNNSSGSSVATARILCPDNVDFVLLPKSGMTLLYDPVPQRWRIVGTSSAQNQIIANTTVSGVVSTTTQSFAGAKTFTGAMVGQSTLGVTGAATLSSTLAVTGNATFSANITVTDRITTNALVVTGATTFSNTFAVTGAANTTSTLGVGGAFTALGVANVISTLGVGGTLSALGSLAVTGTSTYAANANFGSSDLLIDVVNRRVGVKTTPSFELDVNGIISAAVGLRLRGDSANVGGYNRSQLDSRFTINATGTTAMAWNYTNGGGELDFFINRGSLGSVGGMNVYDFPNTLGAPVLIFSVKGDGTVSYPSSQVFSWNTRSANTAYQANTDGFVVVFTNALDTGGGLGSVLVKTDSGSSPSTVRGGYNISNDYGSAQIPVRKGDYYQVDRAITSGSITTSVWWVPVGTSG